MALYLGLMSGTSLDGVDGALADFDGDIVRTLAAAYLPFPPQLRAELMALQSAGPNEIEREALAANQLAACYARCVADLLAICIFSSQSNHTAISSAMARISIAVSQSRW